MHNWLIALILGTVEGITEFLPISSTGHLLIAQYPGWVPRQSELFNVVIQSGAVIAVLPLFPERLNQFFHRWREPATRDYLAKILVAFVLTCIGGLVIDKLKIKLPEDLKPVGVALLVGGIIFLLVEFLLRGKQLGTAITWQIAVAVGLGQLVAAIFPGASRSGTTIILCLLLGLNRPMAVEFSFLVGIPTMLAAGGWTILKALRHPEIGAPPEHWRLVVVTTVISAVVSFIAVKWLIRYVQSHTFNAFGWYRIVVGIAVLVFLCH